MTNLVEPLDSIPFGLWVDERAKDLARDPANWKNARAGTATDKPNGHALLADRLGVGESWLRKGAWRTSLRVERAVVEDALDHFGSTIDELYPELAVRGSRRTLVAWCDGCGEQTTPLEDGDCPWCGGKTLGGDAPLVPCACGCGRLIRSFNAKNVRVHYVRGHKSRPKDVLIRAKPYADFIKADVVPLYSSNRATARALGIDEITLKRLLDSDDPHLMVTRNVVIKSIERWARLGQPERSRRPDAPRFRDLYGKTRCPSCGGEKHPKSTRCQACYSAKPLRRKYKYKMRSDVKISRNQLGRARKMHVEQGMSMRAIARELHPKTTYASEKSLLNALLEQMRRQGWTVRDQSTATAVANRERAFRPQCSHIFKLGPRKGQRCPHGSINGDATCWKHHPERIAANLARLRAANDAKREQIAA